MSQIPKKKRMLYNQKDMQKALEAVSCGMPINTASKQYSVPRTSLFNKINKVYTSDKPGPPTILTSREEENIVKWIWKMCSLGCPVTKEHLINNVTLLVKNLKRPNLFFEGRPG